MALISELKPTIIALIIGVVLVFVGMTAATITGGVGYYVVNTLNKSVSGVIPGNINMFNSNTIGLMGNVFMFAGIALIIGAVVFIIKALWSSVQEIKTTAE